MPGLFDPFDDNTIENGDFRIIRDKKLEEITREIRREQSAGVIDALPPLAANEKVYFMSFGSGSSGNCSYIGDSQSGFLIDAGVEIAKVVESLRRNGISMDRVKGICLTHDHGDHIRDVYGLLRRYRHLRVYCTPKTLNGILRRHNVSRRIKDYHAPIYKEFPFRIGNFEITAFEVMHDGADNSGYFITHGDIRFAIATDLGCISERVDHYMRQATHIVIEANYDLQMLREGRYPEYLKARIMAAKGHMDNEATASYLKEIYTPSLRNVFLCHLSHDNNTPDIALAAIHKALRSLDIETGDGSGSIESRNAPIQISALPRFESTGVIVLRMP